MRVPFWYESRRGHFLLPCAATDGERAMSQQ
jgi:hypothetical protein